MCGVYSGLRLPRSVSAICVARRPSVRPFASTTYQLRSAVAGVATKVFIGTAKPRSPPRGGSPSYGTCARRTGRPCVEPCRSVTAVRRPAAIALLCGALTGCGRGADQPVQLPKSQPASGLVFRGSTSQRKALRIDADGHLLAKVKLLLR